MIRQPEKERLSSFEQFIESLPSLSAEEGLKCIASAKEVMRRGEISVEGYYIAKEVILRKVECSSQLVH